MSRVEVLTEQEVLALPVTIDLTTAAKALGIGKSVAYDLAARDAFPVRTRRYGKKYRIMRSDLLAHLGIQDPARSG
jgi:predicted DNA-binding transcriptional regulator AlpA